MLQFSFELRGKLRVAGTFMPGAGGGGGLLNKVLYTGGLRPEVQTLTLLYAIFDRKGTPFVYLS